LELVLPLAIISGLPLFDDSDSLDSKLSKKLAKIICQAITWLSDSQMQQVTEEVRSVVQSLYNIHEALRQMIVDKGSAKGKYRITAFMSP